MAAKRGVKYRRVAFFDNADDHVSMFVTQRDFANAICNATYIVHYVCGGNPNPVKTFLSVIAEIISHYFANGQHF